MKKRKLSLSKLIFMALCCSMGLFSKKLISPAANILTDALHIPGGIATSFSIMFILVGAVLCEQFGCATLMCVVQSFLALAFGRTGSMGLLAPIAYVVPGAVIDLFMLGFRKLIKSRMELLAWANGLAGTSAAVCANVLTFRLWGPPLWLYVAVAFTSGVISGMVGEKIVCRMEPVICQEKFRW